ncbi:hypothetical protein N9K84_03420 [Candidatus Poseidoniales archaeon]|jgi:hypothetical protein|nr:hypothetical protein [Candidatus Poseidoniales archaeon]MDA8801714.1 hypothetical protein [Candidatus Poseidoniales archaeon]|tara:strand:- start:5624 stop:6856 length:1233 start_codon:yes stop_codon:yes gene_type:complete
MSRNATFLSILLENEELLASIAQESEHRVSLSNLKERISQFNPELSSEQIQKRADKLIKSEPFPILQEIFQDGDVVLHEKITELFLWLSNQLYIVHDKIIETLVETINLASEDIRQEINSEGKFNTHLISIKMDEMFRSLSQLRNISEQNKRAIATQTQNLRDKNVDYEYRKLTAGIIEDHLEPLRMMINDDSFIVQVIDNAETTLGIIRGNSTISEELKSKSMRLSKDMARTSTKTREDHLSAFKSIQPFLDAFLKKQTDLVVGSQKALNMMNEFGVKHLSIPSRITLLRGTRPNNIFSDAAFKKWFIRVNKSTEVLELKPISVEQATSFVPSIPVSRLSERISQQSEVEDLLLFIMEKYPRHGLRSCIKAMIDCMVKINNFHQLEFGEITPYSRGKDYLEVASIGYAR